MLRFESASSLHETVDSPKSFKTVLLKTSLDVLTLSSASIEAAGCNYKLKFSSKSVTFVEEKTTGKKSFYTLQ